MMEAGVVIDLNGEPLHWHLPVDRTVVSLPDSRPLWDIVWENREKIAGIAHSHPGGGVPGPSYEDVTTFSAIERALGRRLKWWITSADAAIVAVWTGPGLLTYSSTLCKELEWMKKLRQISNDVHVANATILFAREGERP